MISKQSPNAHLISYLKFRITQLINTIEANNFSLAATNQPIPFKDQLNVLKTRADKNDLSLTDIFSIEQELVQIYPEDLLDKLYTTEKERYLKNLPTEGLKNIKNIEPELPNPLTPKDHRSRINTLFIWLQNYYHFINERESFIHSMKSNFMVMLFTLLSITLISGYYCLKYQGDLQISLIIGMACAGYLGAIISTVQRIQSMAEAPIDGIDREATLLKIYQGRRGIYLSILLGTIAPFIIFLLLRFIPADKGIVIFGVSFLPVFNDTVKVAQPSIGNLYLSPILGGTKDVAKILFISIISGFSERLIPDVLDRISNELNNKFSSITK